MQDKNSLWIVGCGDVGRRILHRVRPPLRAYAVVRSGDSAARCRDLGASVRQLDLDIDASVIGDGYQSARVIYLAPPPPNGLVDMRIRRFLDALGSRTARIVLVSTTGVYGDQEGEWLDEDTPAAPGTDRGRRRLDAETAVADWARQGGGGYIILRVPGIYAEDRLPLERLTRGLPVVRESEAAYTNRIHAEDLARVCLAALASPKSGLILNATDGHPTTMTEYFNRVADAVGLARPPQVTLEQASEQLSPGMLSYALESRRIGNRRLLKELDMELEYPDLDATLEALARRASE